jgi:hypothetical protein
VATVDSMTRNGLARTSKMESSCCPLDVFTSKSGLDSKQVKAGTALSVQQSSLELGARLMTMGADSDLSRYHVTVTSQTRRYGQCRPRENCSLGTLHLHFISLLFIFMQVSTCCAHQLFDLLIDLPLPFLIELCPIRVGLALFLAEEKLDQPFR